MKPSELVGLSTSHLVECLVGSKHFLIHPTAQLDLLRLKSAASDAGFNLCIASGFRDFERQKAIWNSKMLGQRPTLDKHDQPIDMPSLTEQEKVFSVLLWSALPGTSRHHWGCDFDLYDHNAVSPQTPLQLTQNEYLAGPQHSFFQWLKTHAKQFGFFFPFDGKRSGYQFEPWHVSHYTTWQEIRRELKSHILLEVILEQGLLGEETIEKQFEHIYTQYVMSVNEGDLDEFSH
ncbi:M15 family metallopeptidase [Vibrio astriarenae]|uniref:M15 family metallopeptidase n=1 Tax=Vibrio astriarenae TaxID=1481923 RepID=UPI00373521DC